MNRGMHIRLADDETGFRFSASPGLKGTGYRMTLAKDGRAAFARNVEARAARDPVHILVTDRRMPGMSGMELVAMFRDRGIGIPAIVATAPRVLVGS